MIIPRKNPAAVALGRRGGRSTSEAKRRAARLNGKKGGRPPNVYTQKQKEQAQ